MNQKQLHIVVVSSEFPPLPGGIGTNAYQLAFHLCEIGYQVTVLADYRTYEQEEEIQFDSQLPYRVQRIKRKKNRFRMYLKRIREYRRLLSTSGVVFASGKFSLWLVGFCSFGYGRTPKLAILHGSEVNFQNEILKWSIEKALKRFDKSIAVSQFTAGLVSHLSLDLKVIHNGIELSQWKPKAELKSIQDKYPILITVGNLTQRKGQAKVIEKLPHLLKRYPNIRYDCIGLPTEIEKLQELAKKLEVDKHVYFYGRLSEMELREKLSKSDVFVMLSQQTSSGDVEGFGIAILEANALGIPAIGALGSGIEDAIEQGTSGILVKHSDTEAFAAALETILEHREDFRLGALQWAQAHDWKVIVKRYQEVIEELIGA